jgi:hypothetical protein
MLTLLENGFSLDFDHYAKVLHARFERRLPILNRPSHLELLKRTADAKLDAQLNAQLNNIESSEKAMSKIVNYKK